MPIPATRLKETCRNVASEILKYIFYHPSFLFTWQLLYAGSAGGPKPFYEALEQELDAACHAMQTDV